MALAIWRAWETVTLPEALAVFPRVRDARGTSMRNSNERGLGRRMFGRMTPPALITDFAIVAQR